LGGTRVRVERRGAAARGGDCAEGGTPHRSS
jgi:hypothetical protein